MDGAIRGVRPLPSQAVPNGHQARGPLASRCPPPIQQGRLLTTCPEEAEVGGATPLLKAKCSKHGDLEELAIGVMKVGLKPSRSAIFDAEN